MTALRVVTEPFDHDGPLTDLTAPGTSVAWLQGDHGLLGFGEAARIDTGPGEDRFERARTAFAELVDAAQTENAAGSDGLAAVPGSGLVALGSFTFDAGSRDSTLIVPELVIGRRDGHSWCTRVTTSSRLPELPRRAAAPAARPDRVRYAGSSVPDVHWLEAVADAIGRIQAGDLDKVVLARDYGVWSRTPFDPRDLLTRLNRRFPGCFTFHVDGLVGATPELLVRRFGDRVQSRALAGTARRDPDPEVDAKIGAELLASDKDRREHAFAAATVRDALAPLCHGLEHPSEPDLLRLDNVQHLATAFTGRLADPAAHSSLQLAGSLHPTAAVGGAPTARAVELIRELEGMDRGRYAGPVGWIDAAGDGEWGIALRCAELAGARARLFAGVGVVDGSLPEDELEETRLKLRAMQWALGD